MLDYQANTPSSRMHKSPKILRLAFFLTILSILIWIAPQKTLAATPITGTFYIPDFITQDENTLRTIFQKMKGGGIDTIILHTTGTLEKTCTSTPIYTRTTNLNLPSSNIKKSLKIIHDLSMDIYIGLVGTYAPCLGIQGRPDDLTTDMGQQIDYSLKLVPEIKAAYTSLGISWDSPHIKGLYIVQEPGVDKFDPQLYSPASDDIVFYSELSKRLKIQEPTKKIMLSPIFAEGITYDMTVRSIQNMFARTAIDVVAPQDGFSFQPLATFARSSDHYRGLHDGASGYPDRMVWANIESFGWDAAHENQIPAPISRLTSQIEAARPYVLKTITWIYQYNLLNEPLLDDSADPTKPWTRMYAPPFALLRNRLFYDYVMQYGAVDWRITKTELANNNLTISGYFGSAGRDRQLQILYIDTSGHAKRVNHTLISSGSDNQVITIPYSRIPSLSPASTPLPFVVSQILNNTAQRMYYFYDDSGTCTQTTTPYDSYSTCRANVAQFVSGNTSNDCYTTLAECTSTHREVDGDLTHDGHVNDQDFQEIKRNFNNPYTIYDYNQIMSHWGS